MFLFLKKKHEKRITLVSILKLIIQHLKKTVKYIVIRLISLLDVS